MRQFLNNLRSSRASADHSSKSPKVVEKYEQHYSLELCFSIEKQAETLELCFSIEKQAETVLSGGVFRIGARRSGQVGPLLNGCNDFDETLME